MENFDRENIDELPEIRQIRQYFPRQKFAPYGILISLLIGKFSFISISAYFKIFSKPQIDLLYPLMLLRLQ